MSDALEPQCDRLDRERLAARGYGRLVHAKPLLLSLCVLSGCEFFHTTTVPASDSTDPWAVVAVYFDGDHQDLRLGDMTAGDAANTTVFHRYTTDPFDSFIALGAGVDGGGVHQVRMHTRVVARCFYGLPNFQILEPWATQTTTRTASPGDTVSDGLYLAKPFRGADYLADLNFCSDGSYNVTLEWWVTAEDFHDNDAHYGRGKVTYILWGD